MANEKKKMNLIGYLGQVRQEVRKISWASWRETLMTSVMVMIMVMLTAIFFFIVDSIFSVSIPYLLKLIG